MINLQTYSERINIPLSDIQSKSRKWEIVTARQVYSYFLRNNGYNLNEICRIFGLNHSTVLHGIKKTEDLIKINDKYLKIYLDAIEL